MTRCELKDSEKDYFKGIAEKAVLANSGLPCSNSDTQLNLIMKKFEEKGLLDELKELFERTVDITYTYSEENVAEPR